MMMQVMINPEPESVVVTKMGDKTILFVGLERADAVMVYDVSNPAAPKILQTLKMRLRAYFYSSRKVLKEV
jgi:uncharacterized secreted protein with C-terminal beta-propeller domain